MPDCSQDLESSDDHWEKSLAASAEARRQAQLVEKHSQATHTKLLAAQQATRDFDKARREHMAIQVLGLPLDPPFPVASSTHISVTCISDGQCHAEPSAAGISSWSKSGVLGGFH